MLAEKGDSLNGLALNSRFRGNNKLDIKQKTVRIAILI